MVCAGPIAVHPEQHLTPLLAMRKHLDLEFVSPSLVFHTFTMTLEFKIIYN